MIKRIILLTVFLAFINSINGVSESPKTIFVSGEGKWYGSKRLYFKEELSIGGEEIKKEAILFNPSWVKGDKEGNLYIIDEGDNKIKKYDSRGNFLLSAGGKGQGPGEFLMPYSIQVNEEGIYVLDGKLRKILKFNFNLEFVKEIKLRGLIPLFFCLMDKGKFGVSEVKGLGNEESPLFSIYNEKGEILSGFGNKEKIKGDKLLPILGLPNSFWKSKNGSFYITLFGLYEVRKYKDNIHLYSLIRKDYFRIEEREIPTGQKFPFPLDISLSIFELHDGKILHFFVKDFMKDERFYFDLFDSSGVLLLHGESNIKGYPTDMDNEGKLYFIEKTLSPRVIKASLKLI